MNDSVPVLSLPIKTTLDRFTFAVFLVAMAAHTLCHRQDTYKSETAIHTSQRYSIF